MTLDYAVIPNHAFWIESEFDVFEDDIDPGHRRSARIKYRSLRVLSGSSSRVFMFARPTSWRQGVPRRKR